VEPTQTQKPKQCFRCGKPVTPYEDCGEVVVSGFFSQTNPIPHFNSYILCEECHEKFLTYMRKFLFIE